MAEVSVAVLGATGYTGSELLRLLHRHPSFRIKHVSAHTQAGKTLGQALPHAAAPLQEMRLASTEDPVPDEVELVFAALPHGATAPIVERCLLAGKRVVDLSADFRHCDPDIYLAAYKHPHPYPARLSEAVYGLTEYAREKLPGSRLTANPGCYPTSTLLPLIPLLRSGLLDTDNLIVDSKSGASGAGRSLKTDLLFCELDGGLAAYGLPRHRHAWEMEEWAAAFSGKQVGIRFVPHILPLKRGMLTTLHLKGENPESWHGLLAGQYRGEPFVRVLPEGMLPATNAVAGSNRCDIGIVVTGKNEAVVVSCLDNLLKGAAGQAVQNANAVYGLDESLGLSAFALWP